MEPLPAAQRHTIMGAVNGAVRLSVVLGLAVAGSAACGGGSSRQASSPLPTVATAVTSPHHTAVAAVEATCHSARILKPHLKPPKAPQGAVGVGWQTAEQPTGFGWEALVTRTGSTFRVASCKYRVITHL
jgi:hypothetical protein